MKKSLKAAALAVPAALATTSPAYSQSIDETVNALFSSATGWFVNFIFSPLP